MVEAFSSSDAQEGTGAKENFIGEVDFSRVDCDCEICSSGREAAEQKGVDVSSDFDHVASIDPYTVYDNKQNILGLNVPDSLSYGSKYMVFVGHFENIHGPMAENDITSLEDLADFLEGRVYEWRELTFEEDEEFTWEHANGGEGYTANIKNLFSGMSNKPSEMLVPVREVTDPEELSEIGAEESAEVDDVDF